MAKYTKIIEFYGLPGCGKTTLCNILKESYIKKGYKVGVLTDATKQCSFLRIILVLRLSYLTKFFGIFLNYVKNNIPFNYALSPYKRLLIYQCVKSFSDYDYVFIEHGVIQSMVSALYGYNSPIIILNNPTYGKYLSLIPVDKYIYCKISSEKAYERIRIRDRKSSGRFDQMPDDSLKELLITQSSQFDEFNLILKEFGKDVQSIDSGNRLDVSLNHINTIVL